MKRTRREGSSTERSSSSRSAASPSDARDTSWAGCGRSMSGKRHRESLCQVEHVGLVVSGRCAVKMSDGTEHELTPGDLFHVAPGHDSWVIGDEPYISLHFLGATDYAKH